MYRFPQLRIRRLVLRFSFVWTDSLSPWRFPARSMVVSAPSFFSRVLSTLLVFCNASSLVWFRLRCPAKCDDVDHPWFVRPPSEGNVSWLASTPAWNRFDPSLEPGSETG